jgi:hypothetical protein
MFALDMHEPDLLWNVIWMLKAPKNTHILLWFTIKNKTLTWESLKMSRQGSSICMLCMKEEKTISHLPIKCSVISLNPKIVIYVSTVDY